MMLTFRNYSHNPMVNVKTNPMLENMELVSRITADNILYLETVKQTLKAASGLKLVNSVETFNEDDVAAVASFFNDKKRGAEVLDHLIKYQNSIQQINPNLFNFLRSQYYFFDYLSMPTEILDRQFTDIYFGGTNTISALAVITKFENDVRLYEFNSVQFFYNSVSISSIKWDK